MIKRHWLLAVLAVVSAGTSANATIFETDRIINAPSPAMDDRFGFDAAFHEQRVITHSLPSPANGNVAQVNIFELSDGTVRTLVDPSGNNSGSFGRSIAVERNQIVVGDFGADRNSGKVYLFNANGRLLRTLEDPTPTTDGDRFGFQVEIQGSKVVVSAPLAETPGASQTDTGEVHVFDFNTGELLQTFSGEQSGARGRGDFGFALDIDGDQVLVGARSHVTPTNGTSVGQSYLYSISTGELTHIFDDPTPTRGDSFGSSVAIDSGRVLIGSPGHDDQVNEVSSVGEAHLFDATTGALIRTYEDLTPEASDSFGYSVSLDGNRALIASFEDDQPGVSAGETHFFSAETGELFQVIEDPTRTGGDQFGFSVSQFGSRALISAPFDSTNDVRAGQAHLFRFTNTPGFFASNPLLPVAGDSFEDGFDFEIKVDSKNDTIFIDPDFATGYEYTIDDPNGPLFSAVIVPDVLPGGDGEFLLSVAGQTFQLLAGELFRFEEMLGSSVISFIISGISLSEAIDPVDPLGFVTGIRFSDLGLVNVNQSAIVDVSEVPVPATLPLLLAALATFIILRRRF